MITSIAAAELRMLVRNRLVAACALLIPLGLGAFFVFGVPLRGPAGFTAALLLAVVAGMGVYVTATTTLAARRQTLFLKRLRSGAASDAQIILGLVAPIVLVNVLQVGIVFAALGVTSGAAPAQPALLILTVLVVEVMFAALALATAGVTNSPEHAQVTTLPVFLLAVGAPVLAVALPRDGAARIIEFLPAGALAELFDAAWDGGDASRVPLLLGITLAWAVVAVFVARSMFRWEPRR